MLFLRLAAAAILVVALLLVSFVPYLIGSEFNERVLYGFDDVPADTPDQIEISGEPGEPSARCERAQRESTEFMSAHVFGRAHVFACEFSYQGVWSVLTDLPPFPIEGAASSFEVLIEQPPLPTHGLTRPWAAVAIHGVVVLMVGVVLTRRYPHIEDLRRAGKALFRQPYWLLLPVSIAFAGSQLVNWVYPELQSAYGIQYVAHAALAAMAIAVAAPIGEELLFRGWMLRYLEPVLSPTLALLATSGLFAASHVPGHPALAAYFFAMGLSLGWIRRRTGSVWFAVLAHALVNGIGLLLAGLG